MRAIKLEKDMVFRYDDIPYQIKYRNQSHMKVGDMLILLDGEYKLSHSIDVKVPPTPIKATFVILDIEYKNLFNRMFKSFLKEPIKSMEIKCMAVM